MAFVKNSFFILTVIIMFLISQSDIAFANEAEFASSPNPVGSGARALGMGGAFIGVADDATAASWNPGGLFQVETPEISFVGDWFHRTEDNTFGGHPESNGPEVVSKEAVNYFSMTYPFRRFDRTMVVSLNYQHLYDFTREWNYSYNQQGDNFTSNKNIHANQSGSLSTIGLAYCVQMSQSLSLGFTLNLWDDSFGNKWEKDYRYESIETTKRESYPDIDIDKERVEIDQFSFSGFNANIGMMWRTGKIDVGLVLKLPCKGNLKHDYRYKTIETVNDDKSETFCDWGENDEKLTLPMSYGMGLAYRFSNDCTIAADIYRIEWQDFVRTEQGEDISLLTGMDARDADIKPTVQVRCGLEYLFYSKRIPEEKEWYVVPIRAGIFYDPVPTRGGAKDDYWGFTLGTGYGSKSVVFDVAYQYRTGKAVGSSLLDRTLSFSQDVHEHKIYASIIVRLKKEKRKPKY